MVFLPNFSDKFRGWFVAPTRNSRVGRPTCYIAPINQGSPKSESPNGSDEYIRPKLAHRGECVFLRSSSFNYKQEFKCFFFEIPRTPDECTQKHTFVLNRRLSCPDILIESLRISHDVDQQSSSVLSSGIGSTNSLIAKYFHGPWNIEADLPGQEVENP